MTVGERIRNLREKADISQTDLAKMVDISKQTLYKYEMNVVTNIPSNTIEKIASALQTSPAILMGWENILNPKSDTFSLNDFEKKIIIAYRQADDISKAMVQRVLNIEEIIPETQSSVS